MLKPDMTRAQIEAFTLKDVGVLEAYEQVEIQEIGYNNQLTICELRIHDIQTEQKVIRSAKEKIKKVMATSKYIRHQLMLKEMKGQLDG